MVKTLMGVPEASRSFPGMDWCHALLPLFLQSSHLSHVALLEGDHDDLERIIDWPYLSSNVPIIKHHLEDAWRSGYSLAPDHPG